jgi:hypothetical protein
MEIDCNELHKKLSEFQFSTSFACSNTAQVNRTTVTVSADMAEDINKRLHAKNITVSNLLRSSVNSGYPNFVSDYRL